MTEFLKLTIEERIFALSYICPAFFRNLWWKTFSVKIQVTEILKQKKHIAFDKNIVLTNQKIRCSLCGNIEGWTLRNWYREPG